MSSDLKCDGCGLPSEMAESMGLKLELQKEDGRVLCPVCKDIIPGIRKDILKGISKKTKDFSAYIDITVAMFGLDIVSVTLAAEDIFISGVGEVSEHDELLALKVIHEHAILLKELKDKIETEIKENEKNTDKGQEEEHL